MLVWLTRTVPVGVLHRQPASTPGHPWHMALWKPCMQPPASMQVPGPTAASTGKGVRLGSIESLAFYSLYWRVGGVGKAGSLQLDRCIGFKLLVRLLGGAQHPPCRAVVGICVYRIWNCHLDRAVHVLWGCAGDRMEDQEGQPDSGRLVGDCFAKHAGDIVG